MTAGSSRVWKENLSFSGIGSAEEFEKVLAVKQMPSEIISHLIELNIMQILQEILRNQILPDHVLW